MEVTTDETRIYWTDWFRGQVFAADKNGGARVSLASGQRFAFRSPIVTDDTYVYWTTEDPDGDALTGAIMRRHKQDNTAAEVLLGDQGPIGALLVDDTHLYLTVALAGLVFRLSKDGREIECIGDQQEQPLALALDDNEVYWCCQADGTLRCREKSGGTQIVLASGLELATALLVDDSHIYVAVQSDQRSGAGAILRRAKDARADADEATETFSADQQSPSHMAQDATHVYWTTVGGVWRGAKDSGRIDRLSGYAHVPDPSVPQTLEHAPMGIAVDDNSVYWVDIGEFGGLYGGPKNALRRLT